MPHSINWRRGFLRTEQEAVLCRHMQPRPWFNVGVINRQVEVPADPLAANSPKKAMVVQFPKIQGPVIYRLECRCPKILKDARENLPAELAGQIECVMVDSIVCRICPFWEPPVGA